MSSKNVKPTLAALSREYISVRNSAGGRGARRKDSHVEYGIGDYLDVDGKDVCALSQTEDDGIRGPEAELEVS